jgi:hypothetical protein
MKLHELGAQRPTEQITKVFESHLGNRVSFEGMDRKKAKQMLGRVKALVREHRATTGFYNSERNPTYIKLIMMEQALSHVVNEQPVMPTTGGATTVGATANPGQQAALQTAQLQQNKKALQDAIRQKQKEIADLQKQMNNPMAMAESRRKLKESDLQSAQVVLASQDMIDRIQKMLEQISEMQFKDLPALTDSIKNDMGVDQATQFQSSTAAALTQLLAGVQQGKTQLETAQGVLTGQAPQVPGQDAALGAELGAGIGAEVGDELDADMDVEPMPDEEEDDTEMPAAALGRDRR